MQITVILRKSGVKGTLNKQLKRYLVKRWECTKKGKFVSCDIELKQCSMRVVYEGCFTPLFEGESHQLQMTSYAVFRLKHFAELLELTYLGKHFACVNTN